MISYKSKKIIIIFTTLIVLVLLLFATAWKASNSRYPYSPETRVVNSGQEMFSRYYPPSMETNLCYADAVVRGIVTVSVKLIGGLRDFCEYGIISPYSSG